MFIADDLGAWLVAVLADAGRRKLTKLLVGTDQEQALRSAATAAVLATAAGLCPDDDEKAEHLAHVISQVFEAPAPGVALAGDATMLEELRAGIAAHLAVLDDADLTGTGRSSADVLGLPDAVLAERLAEDLMSQIVVRGSAGGPLFPLASQLNSDVTHLGVRRLGDVVDRRTDEVLAALARLDGSRAALTAPDAVSLDAGWIARSAYLEQVRQIAPLDLRDRDGELAELAGFCAGSGDGQYAWWRAPAWTGKTALMSWFVLHPPSGVRLVSFFVTARYAGQSDRAAFTDVVLEQLAEVLGQPMPAYLTEATRESHLLRMLSQASEVCQRLGQRLALVVDGLDEDSGVTAGPGAHSIAALLPARPAAGLRIVVSGRLAPPVPPDVPDDHPLRDPEVLRVLGPSPWAEVVKADMRRELGRLLHGTEAEQDMLGLVTAAGGGLSAQDLAVLTDQSLYEVEENLQAVAGRTFATRAGRWDPEAAPVYVLGHEELQATAADFLGDLRLTGYRQRLCGWSDGYQDLGWPAGTPNYLLRGYYRMVHAAKDIPRVLACATDQARHDRLLAVTGGDAAALIEITEAQDLVLSMDEPDLVAMARLAMHRRRIAQRNENIPAGLPAVWAVAGDLARAEALLRAITDPYRQTQALTAMTGALATTGDVTAALALAERAEAAARAIVQPHRMAYALTALIGAVAASGDVDRALALAERAEMAARTITIAEWQWEALAAVAAKLAALAETIAAAGDVETAETVARAITDRLWRAWALNAVIERAAADGDFDRAEAAVSAAAPWDWQGWRQVALAKGTAAAGDFDRAQAAISTIADQGLKVRALADLIKASAGDHARASMLAEQAMTIVRAITDPAGRAEALTTLAAAAAAAGQLERAKVLAGQAETAIRAITDPHVRAGTLTALAKPLMALAGTAGAGYLGRVEELARAITDPGQQADTLAAMAVTAAAAGDIGRAERLGHAIATLSRQAQALTDIVQALATSGQPEQAEALARAINDPRQHAEALTALALALASGGSLDRAKVLAQRTETLARSVTDPVRQAEALTALARAAAGTGDASRAEALARAITDARRQDEALAAVAGVLGAAGSIDQAEAVARAIRSPGQQAQALTVLAGAMAAAGHIKRAETLARSVTDPVRQAEALTAVARAAAGTGDASRAEALARAITDARRQDEALAAVAGVLGAAGSIDQAEAVARAISSPGQQAQARALLAGAMAAAGQIERAETLARSVTDPARQAEALTGIAGVTAATGHPDRAQALVEQAESAARAITDKERQADTLAAMARTLAAAGDTDRAEALARAVTGTDWTGRVSSDLVRAVAVAGHLDRAEALARAITDPVWQADALTAVAEVAVTSAGDIQRAEELTSAIANPEQQEWAKVVLAEAIGATGEFEQAEAMARAIVDPDRQARTLAALARDAELSRARSLLARALAVGDWTALLQDLAQIQPTAVITIASEYLTTDKLAVAAVLTWENAATDGPVRTKSDA